MANASKIEWSKAETFDGVTEWSFDGEGLMGDLRRERPARYAAGARHGMARDTAAAWRYGCTVWIGGTEHTIEIPDGLGLRKVKALIATKVAELA